MSKCTEEDGENIQNEESEWSCCSEVSGFAADDYRCGFVGSTKRKRGTSVVHVHRHPTSTADEESPPCGEDESTGTLGGSPISESRKNTENACVQATDDDTLWDDRLMNAHSENDPLALWCQYIKKIEEEEASSDKLFSVLRHCTLLYTQDERYQCDERIVQIWMRYVSCCSDKVDTFKYLESNKLCTFSAMFWLQFSSYYSEELCGLMDSYATLRRGLDFFSTTGRNGSEASVLSQSLQLAVAANQIKHKIKDKLVQENLLLFNDAMLRDAEPTIAIPRGKAEGMTATGEVCEYLCEIFKDATKEVASDFLFRWIHKSHLDMESMQLQQHQQLKAMEQERIQQQQVAEISQQQVREGVERLRQEKERATSEFQKLKASASVDVEIITTMFLSNFEQFCKNEAHLQIQNDVMTNERREHEILCNLMKEKNVALLESVAKTKKELLDCRSKVDCLAKIVKEYQGENQKLLQVGQALIIGLLEDREKEYDACIQNLSSQCAKTLSQKNQELDTLNKSIEDKDACVMMLSEKLTLEQANLLQARQKHHRDDLKLEEMADIIFSEKQKVEDLTKEVSHMGHDTFTLQHSLNQELDASRKLKREGAILEENFRRLEKENDQLRSLIGDEQKKVTNMQDALKEQSKARLQLETEYEKAKIEVQSCQLIRDTLRIEVASKDLQLDKLQKQIANIQACFGKF